ncbi:MULTISPECIES: hypothetical protein [unclassified Arthrobacter]|uniref:hypothetical protein n=1 Tax=unclassified Arthrobacter TaxID=235627 RepID=UPI0021A5FA06|nr:hypothetical protein [Arthrobacter sp. MAHUQ-56]
MAFQPGGEERRVPAPPPRPGPSYSGPPPIPAVPAPPRAVRAARRLWLASFVAGLAVLAGSFLTRDSHLRRLHGVVEDMAPGSSAGAVGAAADTVFWGSIAGLLLFILLEAAVLALVMGRRRRARWALVPLLAGHALVLLVASSFLLPEGDAGGHVVLLWAGALVLACVGLVLLFLPSAGAWLTPPKP